MYISIYVYVHIYIVYGMICMSSYICIYVMLHECDTCINIMPCSGLWVAIPEDQQPATRTWTWWWFQNMTCMNIYAGMYIYMCSPLLLLPVALCHLGHGRQSHLTKAINTTQLYITYITFITNIHTWKRWQAQQFQWWCMAAAVVALAHSIKTKTRNGEKTWTNRDEQEHLDKLYLNKARKARTT